jgi:hypothetical protein
MCSEQWLLLGLHLQQCQWHRGIPDPAQIYTITVERLYYKPISKIKLWISVMTQDHVFIIKSITHTCAHTHPRTYAHARTHTHARTRIYTHTHTHTHTHTQIINNCSTPFICMDQFRNNSVFICMFTCCQFLDIFPTNCVPHTYWHLIQYKEFTQPDVTNYRH